MFTFVNDQPTTTNVNQSNQHFYTHNMSHTINNNAQVLLATANIIVKTKSGLNTVKALIDSGSKASFVTTELTQLLNLHKQKIKEKSVCGIGDKNKMLINCCAHLHLRSNYNKSFCLQIDALVINKLTSYKPQNISKRDLPNLKHLLTSKNRYTIRK